MDRRECEDELNEKGEKVGGGAVATYWEGSGRNCQQSDVKCCTCQNANRTLTREEHDDNKMFVKMIRKSAKKKKRQEATRPKVS